MSRIAKLTFCGGTGTVTGANFLFEVEGKKILVDCGLTQGIKLADDINWDKFPYDPKQIDILFVTHAHIDHLGRIPKLVKEGFEGKIYSTLPTQALARPMLEDTMTILSKNKEYNLEEIYNEETIEKTLSLWEGFEYHKTIKLADNFEVSFRDSGHILGSAMVEFIYNKKKILFTGDLGNSPSPLLPDTEKIDDIDYLIMESVYGDRNHESRDDRKKLLEATIEDNYKAKGTLIIPTFSLERAQELLFEMDDLVEHNRVPVMPVFLDSPLAIRLTEVFERYKDYFNVKAQKVMVNEKHLFEFPGLHLTLHSEESKKINEVPNPKIIIAGSGMSSGGRIVHHEKHYLPDPNNIILLTGYQAVGTIGRLIQEGIKTVKIYGEDVPVRARVVTISGYSGHKDSDALLKFVENSMETLKKVFVVMGEPRSSMYLSQKLLDNLGVEAHVPEEGSTVILNC
ncbi:MAG TPA: MBL fold metallo-hydrolase [Candidatus Paceibacterota bacterium]|nr:MBL fold metallo-hydrolase [Candidatus Paceibacterota bacterium]